VLRRRYARRRRRGPSRGSVRSRRAARLRAGRVRQVRLTTLGSVTVAMTRILSAHLAHRMASTPYGLRRSTAHATREDAADSSPSMIRLQCSTVRIVGSDGHRAKRRPLGHRGRRRSRLAAQRPVQAVQALAAPCSPRPFVPGRGVVLPGTGAGAPRGAPASASSPHGFACACAAPRATRPGGFGVTRPARRARTQDAVVAHERDQDGPKRAEVPAPAPAWVNPTSRGPGTSAGMGKSIVRRSRHLCWHG
jgi:hypothetical protein